MSYLFQVNGSDGHWPGVWKQRLHKCYTKL